MNPVHLDRKDETVDRIARAIGYKGRRIKAIIADTVTFHGTNWDEGSKRDYWVIRLADLKCIGVQDQLSPFRDSPFHDATHKIPDGFVIAVYDQWGQHDHMEIISPAANITPLLPAPVELTDDERKCLISTRSHKSSYGGDSNYRRTQAGMTASAWDAAKASLIARGFLNKAGAITNAGRNAIGNERL